MPALTLPSIPSSYIKSLIQARGNGHATSSSTKFSSIDLETAAVVSSSSPLPVQNATIDVDLMVALTSPDLGPRQSTSRSPTRSDSTSESPNSDFDSMKTAPEPNVTPDSSSSVASPSPSPDIESNPLPGLVSFNLSGNWSPLNSSSGLGFIGSYLWTNDSEARAEFKFRGVAAYLYVPRYEGISSMPRNSSININLDTGPTAVVDLSATVLGMSNHSAAKDSKSPDVIAWVGDGLPDDEHTLVLSLPGGASYAVFSALIYSTVSPSRNEYDIKAVGSGATSSFSSNNVYFFGFGVLLGCFVICLVWLWRSKREESNRRTVLNSHKANSIP